MMDKPTRSLLDPAFRYVPSVETNIRKTFAKARRRIRAEAEAQARAELEAREKVRDIKRGAK